MSADPASLHRLMRILYFFFLRVLYWFFSTKPRKEPDDEARIDLPMNIIYGEKLPAWMTEPPTSFKETDNSQPLRHSEEWAQQKANFLRSPSLKKKYMRDDTSAQARAPRVRFSDFLVEYPRTPSDEYSQDLSLPPTIRIEDWSTPPSPEASPVSISESLTVVETPFPLLKLVPSSSRDSLTVPSLGSPGLKHSSRTLGRRQVAAIRTGQTCEQLRFDYNPEHKHGCKDHAKTRRLGPKKPPQPLKRDREPDEFTFPKLVRPARTSKSFLSPSLLDLLETTSISADRIDLNVRQVVRETDKQKITTHRGNIRDSLPASRSLMGARGPQQRQRKSNKVRSMFKRHHSQPLSTMSTVPFRDGADATVPCPGEKGKDKPGEAKDYYRHSIDVVGMPFPMGIVLSSEAQTAILTRFHEKGLAMTPERCSSGFRRQILHPSGKFHKPSISLSLDAADVPYPYVFDLDEYFQALSPCLIPAIPASPVSIPQISSPRNRSHDAFGTPTPSSRPPLSNNIFASAHAPGPTRTRQSSRSTALSVDKYNNEHIMHRAIVHERDPFTGPFDTDEKQQFLSRFEYSDESSSSEDLPLSSWLSQHLESQGRSDKRKGFVNVTNQTGTALEQRTASVKPDTNLVLNSDPARRMTTKNGKLEMDQIRASLRSHYMFTRQQRDSFHESSEDDNDNSLASLVESYSSGSTLSYRHGPHQWAAKGLPSPRYDRRLDPVIEATSESECSNGTIISKAVPSPRFSPDDIITVDRTPQRALVLPPRRAGDSVNLASFGFDLGLQQSRTARVSKSNRHRGPASSQNDRGVSAMNESTPRMQKKVTTTGALTENSNSVGMAGSKVAGERSLPSIPLKPVGRGIVPQKF